jgi:hypothetical protein
MSLTRPISHVRKPSRLGDRTADVSLRRVPQCPFNKSSYMKKFIQDRTLKDLKADYELWLHSIQETLENIKNRTSRR